jgi:hypothetical protein
LDALEAARKKRNELREGRRRTSDADGVSDDEPNVINPLLAQFSQQPTMVPTESTMIPCPQSKVPSKQDFQGLLFLDAQAVEGEFQTHDTSIPQDITVMAGCNYHHLYHFLLRCLSNVFAIGKD